MKRAVFDRLEDALQGYSRIFIAPDGDLSRLPFEVLPVDDNRCLIDDYRISYLSAGRDVLRFGMKGTSESFPALVLADPDFDIVEAESGSDLGSGRSKITELISVSRSSRDFSRSDLDFERLPGTRPEGERIAGLPRGQAVVSGRRA